MFNVDSINRLAKRIRLIKGCPARMFVTLRSEHGHYYDLDISGDAFIFVMRNGRPDATVYGHYKEDVGGYIQLTQWTCTLTDDEVGDLLHTIDRTIALHTECNYIVLANKHLFKDTFHV
ncbi:hypothetical protein [Pseudomonas phage PA1C]|uniref:Uncharacterized protein n=1 Tax=Pseudomonas phage vB_PaeM_PS119XW TaxID=2601632 RepID=A0A5C1K7Q7_9CAUD|nr:hypothetical protein PP933_gp196 [Pseudomonas phage vB_PaeM_PS119XW]QBX32351.1 hypothetical protein [Pseudomonas phage PA1C]QEM41925.1 hypothetical protein [Pseudomonas phage vB_PaeM_PS119XW]BEG72441.1 hypothetical protein RVBP21_0690 [Pseudomonas phage BRkr]